MYSAFSERSPCAAASETSCVTRGRSRVHSSSSSARSVFAPSGVMYDFLLVGAGGRAMRMKHIAYAPRRHMGSELLIVVGLLMVHGLFAGSEIAVLTVRKTR